MLKAGCGAPHGPDAVSSWWRLKSAQVASPTCSMHREDCLLGLVLGGHERQFVRQVRLEEDRNVPGKQDGDEIAGTERKFCRACSQQEP